LFSGRFGIHNGIVSNTDVGRDNFFVRTRPYGGAEPENEVLMRHLRAYGYDTISFSTFADRHNALWFMSGWTEYHTPNLKRGFESSEEVNARLLPWLKQNARREDYFLHINYWDTHRFYTVPPHLANRFKDIPVAQPWPDEDAIRDHQDIPGLFTAQEQLFKDGISHVPLMPSTISSRKDFEHLVTGYDATIAYTDQSIGAVLEELDRQGVLDDAAIIISADHGEAFGEHGIYCGHVCANECTHRIPLIIRWPGVSVVNQSSDALLYNVDLASTLCDLLGLPIPSDWDGVSFKDNIQGKAGLDRDYLVWDHAEYTVQRAVRTRTHLMTRTYDNYGYRFEPLELYNLTEDPYTVHNICSTHPEIVHQCDHYMMEWSQEQIMRPCAIVDPLQRVLEDRKRDSREGVQ
jgi:arylsulfatase A-like enzyme